jgi:hypothetical protein
MGKKFRAAIRMVMVMAMAMCGFTFVCSGMGMGCFFWAQAQEAGFFDSRRR